MCRMLKGEINVSKVISPNEYIFSFCIGNNIKRVEKLVENIFIRGNESLTEK